MSDRVQDAASAAAGTVNDATAVVSESAESLIDLVRRYPMPSLLLGLGLGYLLMPQTNKRKRRYYDDRTSGSTLSTLGSTMTQTVQDLAQNVAETAGGMKERAEGLASAAASKVSDTTTMMGESADSLVDMARSYPVPSFLTGLGLGYWLASATR